VSSWTVLGILVGLCVAVAAAVVIAALAVRRRQAPPAPARATPAAHPVAGPELGRRQLLHQGLIGLFVAALAGVVSSVMDFLWPSITGTTGGDYLVGSPSELDHRIEQDRTPYYDANGRFYLVPFPADRLAAARTTYQGPVLAGMERGFVALSQRCPHLGCRVPWCESSQWFECPCHGSRFNAVGERQSGPAPRGMDHFGVDLSAGAITVDTRTLYLGAPPGTDTIDEPARGPHCY
jgi:cytochrome b6-f complex iron-sulfur subunit